MLWQEAFPGETGERQTRKGNCTMSERKTELKAREWADEIPDEEDDRTEPYEETYRDGSAKNECWGDREHG